MTKVVNSTSEKIDLPGLFFIILILFFISLGVVIFGVAKGKFMTNFVGNDRQETINTSQNDGSLDEYFEEGFARESGEIGGNYIDSDPFKGICGQAQGAEAPSVTSNTVCLY